MQRIFKYRLDLAKCDEHNNLVVKMPASARPLSAGVQLEQLHIWALIDDNDGQNMKDMVFAVHGTGHYIEPGSLMNCEFLGTHIMEKLGLVWHIWVRGWRNDMKTTMPWQTPNPILSVAPGIAAGDEIIHKEIE